MNREGKDCIVNLDSNFTPFSDRRSTIKFEKFTFNGGEPHVKLSDVIYERVMVTARIKSFNDLGMLLALTDALKRKGTEEISLFLPYFPGARQDRVMMSGEPLTVKVYADIINAQHYKSVTILDPHSDVAPALIDRCIVIDNEKFVVKVMGVVNPVTLISPDAGSAKKMKGYPKVVFCSKKRDVTTGALSDFEVHSDDLKGENCLIVDDICDGGRTFIELTKKLKEKNAGLVYLAVTHGIFSKGFDAMLNAGIEKIFTTDSFWDGSVYDSSRSKVICEVIKLKDL